MLTTEGYDERKWGPFPFLRKVLADKRESDCFHGWTSVSDNVFEQFNRWLNMAAQVNEYRDVLLEAAKKDSSFLSGAIHDLRTLIKSLDALREVLSTSVIQLDQVCQQLHQTQHLDESFDEHRR